VEALTRLQQAHGWIDIGRQFIPAPERCFTWWSYRSPDWTRNDRGRRLDHMWCSREIRAHVGAHRVLERCRNWERPSDHVPLICEIEI
jgi:exodeoxyribonuclease-3